jgi:hypothetical protein
MALSISSFGLGLTFKNGAGVSVKSRGRGRGRGARHPFAALTPTACSAVLALEMRRATALTGESSSLLLISWRLGSASRLHDQRGMSENFLVRGNSIIENIRLEQESLFDHHNLLLRQLARTLVESSLRSRRELCMAIRKDSKYRVPLGTARLYQR